MSEEPRDPSVPSASVRAAAVAVRAPMLGVSEGPAETPPVEERATAEAPLRPAAPEVQP
jgi:hypothetical protein